MSRKVKNWDYWWEDTLLTRPVDCLPKCLNVFNQRDCHQVSTKDKAGHYSSAPQLLRQPWIWVSLLSLLLDLDWLGLRRLMNRTGIRTANSKVPVCQLVCIPSRFSQVLILLFSVAQEQDRKKRELGPARKISVCASPPWFHPPLHKVMDSGRPVDTMDTWMAVTLRYTDLTSILADLSFPDIGK